VLDAAAQPCVQASGAHASDEHTCCTSSKHALLGWVHTASKPGTPCNAARSPGAGMERAPDRHNLPHRLGFCKLWPRRVLSSKCDGREHVLARHVRCYKYLSGPWWQINLHTLV